MRLDFNAMWVDDQPARVGAQAEAIAKQMRDEGFEFRPTFCETIDQVRSAMTSDVFTDEIDLVLVDWDLGGGVQGQTAIAEIRERLHYKDIVFYSAQTAPEELRKMAFEGGLEGIYCAARDGLVDEVIGVFDSLVKKVLDLDHTRGIVMGATSDIDHMVEECLVAIHQGFDDSGKQKMISEALALIAEQLGKHTKRAKELEGATSLESLFEARLLFTAYDRLRILTRVLEAEALKDHSGARVHVTDYMQRVVPERNILGHQIRDEKTNTVLDNKGQPMTLERTRELRRSILNLRHEFRNLLLALRPRT